MLPWPILLGGVLVIGYLVLGSPASPASMVPAQPQPPPQPTPPLPANPSIPMFPPAQSAVNAANAANAAANDSVPPFVPGFNQGELSPGAMAGLQGPNPGLLNPQPTPPPVGGSVPWPVAPAMHRYYPYALPFRRG